MESVGFAGDIACKKGRIGWRIMTILLSKSDCCWQVFSKDARKFEASLKQHVQTVRFFSTINHVV